MDLPEKVGVYGGGRMGAGIAHSFLAGGCEVTIVESTQIAAVAAQGRVSASVSKAQAKGLLPEAEEKVLARLRVVTSAAELSNAQLVIEALPEDAGLKASVLAGVHDTVPDAWLATNTSSLSVDGLAAGIGDPSRLIGLHFFNPVPASDLVEVVVGSATSDELVAASQSWVAHLGKTAVTVRDSPGFASSRLGVAIALEAMRMLEEDVASAADIDTAMTLGYRHPVGPLRTTDLVGLDVRLAISQHLERELGPRFSPPQLLRDKVAAGELGRKSGQGFFAW